MATEVRKDFFRTWLDRNMHRLENPAAYIGDEPGTEIRDWSTSPLNICVVGAAPYDNLTGNLAVPMLTRMLLEHRPDWVVERAFLPNKRDMEYFLKHKIPVFSLETKRRLNDFDVLAISCSFAGTDLNVIQIMDMCKIPIKWFDREESHPWIIRGGQNDSNITPFMQMYDMCYIGEAEVNFPKVLETMIWAKQKGVQKLKVKQAVASKLRGILIPEFYEPEYDEDGIRFKKWHKTWAGAPYPVKAARIPDLNSVYVYSHPIVNYLEEMGSGELLISRGCVARCMFCNEGHKEKPYREMTADRVIEAVRNNMIESGAKGPTLSAFCISSYRQKRLVVKRLMEEVSDEVHLMSERIDEIAADPMFMKWTGLCGNRRVSFGVEGMSERLRKLVNKHCTSEQIVKAVRAAIEGGYTKIKLYMIANLPTETAEDREEWVELAGKVKEVRDEYPDKNLHIRFNFTDLLVFPHTPFQWIQPTSGQRHLTPYIHRVLDKGLKIGFGVSKSLDQDTLLQILNLGDPRMMDPFIRFVRRGNLYWRSVRKGCMVDLVEEMEKEGISLETYWRERQYEEPLPWDIVSYGVPKSYLWKMWQRALAGGQTPKCSEDCEKCGALGCVGVLPPLDEPPDTLPNIIKRVPVDQHLMIQISVDEAHRYVPANCRKQLMRRALYLHEVPVMKDPIEVCSDAWRDEDYVPGIDYVAIRLYKRLTEPPELASLNNVFKINHVSLRDSGGTSRILNSGVAVHSKIKIHHPINRIRSGITTVMAGKIKIRTTNRMGSETLEFKSSNVIFDLWESKESTGFYLHALHDGAVSIYDVYYNVLRLKAFMDVPSYSARRMEVYVMGQELGAPKCKVCMHMMYQTVEGKWNCVHCEQ